MKKIDYKAMTNEELTSNYILLKRNLFNLKLQNSVGQLSNPHEITVTKKNIARVLTEMTARNIDSSKINMPVEKKKAKKAAAPKAAKTTAPKAVKEPAKAEEIKTEEKPAAKKATTAKTTATKTSAAKTTASAEKKPAATKKTTTAKKENA